MEQPFAQVHTRLHAAAATQPTRIDACQEMKSEAKTPQIRPTMAAMQVRTPTRWMRR